MTNTVKYRDARPLATVPLCNFGGLVILDLDAAAETAVSGFDFGNGPEKIRVTRIHTAQSGRMYIRRYGVLYYLDEMVRI